MDNFYCQKVVGDEGFSIDEWNQQFKLCNYLGIEMPEEQEACKEQCFDCIAIVGKRRIKTNEIINPS